MKKHIIGITPRFCNEPPKVQANYSYFVPFNKRDIIPIVLPVGSKHLKEVLDLCDGFLIIGGDDIDPKYYNQENKGFSRDVQPLIDEVDLEVIEYIKKNPKPTLGICRGIQSLAAFWGGSLYQDLDNEHVLHTSSNNEHDVVAVANTPLTKLLPSEFKVNTYHHQAVKRVPTDFIVSFMHDDAIEAIEHKNLPILGVQWHPERYDTKESEIIFDYFVSLIKKYAK